MIESFQILEDTEKIIEEYVNRKNVIADLEKVHSLLGQTYGITLK